LGLLGEYDQGGKCKTEEITRTARAKTVWELILKLYGKIYGGEGYHREEWARLTFRSSTEKCKGRKRVQGKHQGGNPTTLALVTKWGEDTRLKRLLCPKKRREKTCGV